MLYKDVDRPEGAPPLRHYYNEAEYKFHYRDLYCREEHYTREGDQVQFFEPQFDHAFQDTCRLTNGKIGFCHKRAERIDWIAVALQDSGTSWHTGWDAKKQRFNPMRRVGVAFETYVVVLEFRPEKNCYKFITAFVAELWYVRKVLASAAWAKPNEKSAAA